MPSSISSSDDRLPRGPWGRTWLLALLLTALLLGGFEAFWRSRGFVPALVDDARLWATHRRKVDTHDPHEVVIIGTSRIQLGLDLDALAQGLGRKPIQLAIDGGHFLPHLEHFALNTEFRGVLICDAMLGQIFAPATEYYVARPREYLQHYLRESPLDFDGPLGQAVASHAVFRLTDVRPSPANLIRWIAQGALPEPSYIRTAIDRSRTADYARFERIALHERTEVILSRLPDPLAEPELRDRLELINRCVDCIVSRGGRVVFLRMPVSTPVLENETRRFPADQYWSRFTAGTRAITIDAMTHDDLRIPCPDGSHLDRRDVARFSSALARHLISALSANANTLY